MKILYHNRSPVKAGGAGAEYEYCANLEEMLGRCDAVSLNLPVRRVPLAQALCCELEADCSILSVALQLNANTEKSFGAKQFGWMKKGSILVNTAR